MGLGVRTAVLSRLAGVSTRVASGVALTFDDGPVPGTTDALFDLLAELGVPATSFCVGPATRSGATPTTVVRSTGCGPPSSHGRWT